MLDGELLNTASRISEVELLLVVVVVVAAAAVVVPPLARFEKWREVLFLGPSPSPPTV